MPASRQKSASRLGEFTSSNKVRLQLIFDKDVLLTQVDRWLYSLFVAIDANFRLKRKAVSSDQVDPGLNAGWAYFVEERAYKSYLSERTNERQEVCM
jgi:hypothetical protein